MDIEGTKFGSITIDRKIYEHDVVIRLSGEVIKRKKKLSKKYYGTSHVLSKDEAKFVFEKGCEQFIIGSAISKVIHQNVELVARYLGELQQHSVQTNISVLVSPEYLQLRNALIKALGQFPEAKRHVAQVLYEIEGAVADKMTPQPPIIDVTPSLPALADEAR